jgi:hypothetical protein
VIDFSSEQHSHRNIPADIVDMGVIGGRFDCGLQTSVSLDGVVEVRVNGTPISEICKSSDHSVAGAAYS